MNCVGSLHNNETGACLAHDAAAALLDAEAGTAAAAALAPSFSAVGPVFALSLLALPMLKDPSCWIKTRASAHRIGGFIFLLCWGVASWQAWHDPVQLTESPWLLFAAVCGLLQAITASHYFRFLPAKKENGLYANTGVISKLFVQENVFFQMMTTFGVLLYTPQVRDFMVATPGLDMLARVMVYLPYILVRPHFPKTSFSDNYGSKNIKGEKYTFLFEYGIRVVKLLFLWSKHVMGQALQAAIWTSSMKDDVLVQGLLPLLVLNVGTVSIGVFLHTLRFKFKVPAWFTFGAYVIMYMMSWLWIPTVVGALGPLNIAYGVLGLALNFLPSKYPLYALWCGACTYDVYSNYLA